VTDEINLFRCLEFIKSNAKAYAQAKANRIYLENFRKSKKAMLMRLAEADGQKTAAIQERDAYANQEYLDLLEGLREAVAEEERLRWLMVAAEVSIESWRSLESSKRAEVKGLG
jgi:hypothetical protein